MSEPMPCPTVLVIDDDEIILEFASAILRDAGYEVVTAGDAAEGLDLLWQLAPDLLILDCGLPDQSGINLLQTLRSTASFSDLAIIMLTARRSVWFERVALETGASAFLRKPCQAAELVRLSAELLAQPPGHTTALAH